MRRERALPVGSVGRLVKRGRALAGTSTAQGAAKTLVLKALEAGAAFIAAVVLARVLGATEFGLYSLALAWAGLLTIPALVGMENLAVRHASAYSAQQRWSHVRGLLRRIFQVVAAVSIAITLIAAAGATSNMPTNRTVPVGPDSTSAPAALMRLA
ncbi:MAG TPA: oligosaccharide flippase family protein, partial [Candidatus Limnocylindria bacterium]|nr:oligosaccharide flippase family protein [Candidatus Limnocylindria bacterium]